VRRLPRGVRKADYARRNYFDFWLPELAPSPKLFGFAQQKELTGKRWETFAERYRAEMKKPAAARLLGVLAELSHQASFSVGCYCEDENRCHRSLLRELLKAHGAKLA
jgi:uncharacterized protein YeaO (DUF488 family)